MGMVLPGAFRVGPDLTLRPNLVSHVDYTAGAAVHAHLPHSPRGALERRNACQRARLRLHPPDEPFRRGRVTGYAEALAQVASVRPLDARTVRVVLRSRYARLAQPLSVRAPGACARRRRLRHGVERRGSTTRGPGARSEAAPSSSGAGSAAVRSRSSATRATGEADRRISTGSCSGSGMQRTSESIEGLRRGELDLVHGLLLSVDETREVRQLAGVRVQSVPGPGWDHLEFRVRLRVIRPCATSSCGGRSRMRSTETALVRARVRGADRRDAVTESAFFATTSRLLPAELERSPLRPGRVAPAAQAGGLPPRRGRNLRLRGGAALAAGVHDAGQPSARRRCGSFRSSCGGRGSRSCPAFAALRPAVRARSCRAATSTSRSSRGFTTATSRAMSTILALRRQPELHRLLPAPRRPRPRRGGARTRRRPARARAQQNRRAGCARRAAAPPLPQAVDRRREVDASGATLRSGRAVDPLVGAENWWLARR